MGFLKDNQRPRRSLACFIVLSLLLSALLPFGPLTGGYDVRAEEATAPPAAPNSLTHLAVRANNEQGTATLRLAKVSAADKAPLAGAEFTLRDTMSGSAWAVDTDLDGRAAFASLPAGSYELRETRAAAGYDPDPTLYTIEIGKRDGAVIADVYGTVRQADGTAEQVQLTQTIAVRLDTSALDGEDPAAEHAKLAANLDVTLSLLYAEAIDYSNFNDIPQHFADRDTLLFSGIPTSAQKAKIDLNWDANAPEEQNISKGYQFEIREADVPEPDADHTFLVRVTALEATEASTRNEYEFNILRFIVGPEKDAEEAEAEIPFAERFGDLDPNIIQTYALLDRDGLQAEIERVQRLRDDARETLDELRSEAKTREIVALQQDLRDIPEQIADLEAERQDLLNRHNIGGGGVDVEVGDIVLDDTDDDDTIIVDGEGTETTEATEETTATEDDSPDIIIEEGESATDTPAEATTTETEPLPASDDPAIQELTAQIDELQRDLTEKQQALDAFQEQLASAEEEHADAALRLDLLRYHVERLTEEQKQAEAEAQAAAMDRAATETIEVPTDEDLDLPVAEPEDTAEDVQAKIDAVQNAKDQTFKEIKQTKDDIHDLYDELDDVQEELEQAEADLEALTRGTADGGGGESIDLTVGPVNRENTVTIDGDQVVRIKALEATIARLNDRRQDILLKIAGGTANIATFEAKLTAFSSAIDSLKTRLAFLLRPDSVVARSEALDIAGRQLVLAGMVGTPPPNEQIEIIVDKTWGPDPNDEKIPMAINVVLTRKDNNGNQENYPAETIFKDVDNWHKSLGFYDRYIDNDPDKGEWMYEIEEQPVDGYELQQPIETQTGTATDGTTTLTFKLTNNRLGEEPQDIEVDNETTTESAAENIQLRLRKVWELGDQSVSELPAEVKFTVKQTDPSGTTQDLGPYTLTADNAIVGNKYTWEITVPDLPFKAEDGTTYSYEVTEDVPEGYEAVVEKTDPQNGEQTFTVKNTKKQETGQRQIDIVLQKTWQLVKSDSKISGKITFTLKRKDPDGNTEDVGDFSLSENDGDKSGTVRVWTKSLGSFDYWPDPADHAKGHYTYFVEEKSIAGFKGVVENPDWDETNGKLTLKVKNTQDGYEEPKTTTTQEDGTVTTTIPGTGETRSLWVPLGLALCAILALYFRRRSW